MGIKRPRQELCTVKIPFNDIAGSRRTESYRLKAFKMTDFTQQRLNMLESQIRPFSVTDQRVLQAFQTVAREEYIPAERRGLSYLGGDLPMGQGRFMVEPAAHARLLQEAAISPEMSVLDIGCLTGYSTAILSHITPHVVGLDTVEWVAQAKNLARNSLEFTAGALDEGFHLKEFDVIVINGAVQKIPAAITAQLKEGGVIATFWRGIRNQGHAVLYHKQNGALREQVLFDAFAPVLPGFENQEGFVF
jgi:protein-L-isoaspartate(D-aspartate) O-methyltransferase